MTLKSRTTTAIIIGVILIAVAILVWANQTGRISMFASEENTTAKSSQAEKDLIAKEKEEWNDQHLSGTIETITTDNITIKTSESEESKSIKVNSDTSFMEANYESYYVKADTEKFKPGSYVTIYLNDGKDTATRIDLMATNN